MSTSGPEQTRAVPEGSAEETAAAIWLPLDLRGRLWSIANAVTRADSADRWLVFPFAVTTIFAVFDLIRLPSSTLIVPSQNYLDAGRILAMLLVCYAIGRVMSRRYRKDDSPPGVFVRRRADGLAVLAKAGALFVPFAWFSALFMYLASATTAPLVDGQLTAIDKALGFDWLAFLELTDSSPLLTNVLVFAYATTGVSVVAIFLFHSFTLREGRLLEFMALLSVTSLITGTLMFWFPAAGAYAWFQPSPEAFSNFPANAGMWHYSELMALRSGEPFTFIAANGTGLVTFPSFHTQLGIIITYSVRGIRFVFPTAVILNSIMIVATLPQGGHYLIDVIVGVVIAAVALVCVRAYDNGR